MKKTDDLDYWKHVQGEERMKLSALIGWPETRKIEAMAPAIYGPREIALALRSARQAALEAIAQKRTLDPFECAKAAGLA